MKTIIIHTVNKKAVKILQKFTYTTTVEFIKTGKTSSVMHNVIKYFDKKVKKNINQLKLEI